MICSTLRTTALLLFGVCLAIPCDLAAQATTTTTSHVQGIVLLGGHNEPLDAPGAKVFLYGDTGISSTITDRDGKFSFSDVEPPGIYFLEATYQGFRAEQNITVDADTVVQVSLRLEAPDPSISATP
jgi:hypothetical protein